MKQLKKRKVFSFSTHFRRNLQTFYTNIVLLSFPATITKIYTQFRQQIILGPLQRARLGRVKKSPTSINAIVLSAPYKHADVRASPPSRPTSHTNRSTRKEQSRFCVALKFVKYRQFCKFIKLCMSFLPLSFMARQLRR